MSLCLRWLRFFVTLFKHQREAIKYAIDQNDVCRMIQIFSELRRKENNLTPYTWMLCFSLNRIEMIHSLLSENLIDPNFAIDKYEWTPLHVAVYQKNSKLIEMLLAHGSDVCVFDTNGNTPLHIAIQSCQKTTSNDRSHYYHSVVNIVVMLLNGYKTQCQSQTSKTKFVNMRNNFGKCALHYAVLLQADHLAVSLIHLLLAHGADPDVVDAKQRTSFFYPLSELKFFLTTTGRSFDSPFLSIFLQSNCDKLNYNQIIGKVSTLKELCREFIQKNDTFKNKVSQFAMLPHELQLYLKRRIV
ncbi:uncharacterized protein B4U79_06510 [Dinothrombium tinctorium]|uniref:Uncharacterized protein n=1 Tax=Dinothrombium tinctorium TaxID=1965070 RepID=A0A443RS31_9ACAR|nr:uncharacterized protein B4U79_06510 [Dinothrombium tinctorium]